MHVVFWTIARDLHGPATDHYITHETQASADGHCAELAKTEGVLCWGAAPIRKASEGHWPAD